MAERVYAFDEYAAAAVGVSPGAGVTIAPRRPAAMLNARGGVDALADVVRERYAVQLPREPNTAAGSSVRALWLGPDEWLLVLAGDPKASFPEGGAARFTDVSHGRAALRLRGDSVRDTLAKGCPLDLDPRVFTPGRCAQTAIGRVSVILDHVEPDVFDVYCSRSYAGSFWHWLIEAGAEYRYAIAPPE